MAKFLSDNADVLQTLYNVPLSAASAVALNQCSSNFRYGGRKRLFIRKQRPMLSFDCPISNLCCFQLLVIWRWWYCYKLYNDKRQKINGR